jgi:hypothetical protein
MSGGQRDGQMYEFDSCTVYKGYINNLFKTLQTLHKSYKVKQSQLLVISEFCQPKFSKLHIT